MVFSIAMEPENGACSGAKCHVRLSRGGVCVFDGNMTEQVLGRGRRVGTMGSEHFLDRSNLVSHSEDKKGWILKDSNAGTTNILFGLWPTPGTFSRSMELIQCWIQAGLIDHSSPHS